MIPGTLCIPSELIRPIIEHLQHDKRALYHLSLCCSLLHSEANIILYRQFTYAHEDILRPFLTTVSENPSIAALVKIFHLYLTEPCLLEDLTQIIIGGLGNMHNLTELAIRPSVNATYASTLLEHVSPSVNLKTFLWSIFPSHSDAKVLNFIEHHRNLTHLRWTCLFAESKTDVLPPSACPNVVTFEGNRAAIHAFLPGRQIRRLVSIIDATGHDFRGPIDALHPVRESFHHIRSLSFLSYLVQYLVELLPHLRNLQALEIVEYVYEEFFDATPDLPSLTILVFTPEKSVPTFAEKLSTRQRGIVNSLFATYHALQRIHIQTNAGTLYENDKTIPYNLWKRDVSEPSLISLEEVQIDLQSLW